MLIIHWLANESEEFVFENTLESFQNAEHRLEKLLRSSNSAGMYALIGTVYA